MVHGKPGLPRISLHERLGKCIHLIHDSKGESSCTALVQRQGWSRRERGGNFFKILFIYFSWRIISLQYCGGFFFFCHTLTWITHGCTCVPLSWNPLPPPSPPHPSGFPQSPGFERPASCNRLALVIYFTYGTIHVSVLFRGGNSELRKL